MNILVGKRYLYRVRQLDCIVTTIFPDRHRCIIELPFTGQQVQEVPYTDLEEIPEPSFETKFPASTEAKSDAVENLDEQKSDDVTYPLKNKTSWRKGRGK